MKQTTKRKIHTPANKQQLPPKSSGGNLLRYMLPAVIALITFICFQPALDNNFIKTWDDNAYVINNSLIRELNAKTISEIFSFDKPLQKLTKNYHPLTTLSLAVNYHTSQLTPRSYFLTNILIHTLNAVLVFIFIFLLSRKKLWVAAICGLWFGIHPMHVESVAWISERKDVLYAFFFLCGLISYHFHLTGKSKWKYIALAFLFFFLSSMSKAMAVPFPLVMILMDIFYRRKFAASVWLEKLPFFAVSLFFGLLSLRIQADGAMGTVELFSPIQRLMHGSYGFLMYLVMLLAPINLNAFYPYPLLDGLGNLPWAFRMAPFIFILVTSLSAWLLFRKNHLQRVVGFGMMFYLLLIILVLQFLSVGMTIMADRYTYLPYIGLFFIIGEVFVFLMDSKNKSFRYAGYLFAIFLFCLTILFIGQTRSRISVWANDISLWTDSLEKIPDQRMNRIRDKRARMYLLAGENDKALKDVLTIVRLDSANAKAWEFGGRIYGLYLHDPEKSIEFLEKGLSFAPDNPSILKALGVANGIKGNIRKALDYSLRAYQIDPADTVLIYNIIASYKNLGEFEKAKEFERIRDK